MVESTSNTLANGQCGLIVPNPTCVRGMHTEVKATDCGEYLMYACEKSFVLRHFAEPTTKSVVYPDCRTSVTAFAQRPNGFKNEFAIGTESGLALHVSLNEAKEWTVQKELPLLGGKINQLIWSDDGERLIGMGEGDQKAAGVLVATGNKIGDIFGHTDKVLTGILTPKPHKLIAGGESKEILLHTGFPFKGQGERVTHPHEGFINQITMSPDGTKFMTAGADKNIVIYNSEDQAKQRQFKAHTMGIYGAHWLDNDNFATCSADNKVKTWKIDGGETPERTLLQTAEEVKRADPEKQVLGLYSGPDGAIGGVNLHNELLSWSTDNTLQKQGSHSKAQIKNLMAFGGNLVWTSDNRIYISHMDSLLPIEVLGTTSEQAFDQLTHNTNAVFATGFCKSLIRLSESAEGMQQTHKCTLAVKAIDLAADDENLYVLNMQKEIQVYGAADLAKGKTHKLDFEPTCFALCAATQHLWVGDKKGPVHVLKADDFSEVHKFEKHTKNVTCIVASGDGTKVATGDNHRYFYIHDAASFEMQATHCYHKDKIFDLSFSEDASKLAACAHDGSFSVVDVAANKTKSVKFPHGEKNPKLVAVLANGKVVTNAEDMTLRVWDIEC